MSAYAYRERGFVSSGLIVEDDEDVRSFSVNAARHLGYNVLEAGNAADALALLAGRSDIRLLFTDLCLPGMNGCDLASAAVAEDRTVKVLFSSGYAKVAVAGLGTLERDARLLPKPFRIEALAHGLRSTLDAV